MNAYGKVALIIEKIGFAQVRVLLLLVTMAICAYFLAKGTTRLIIISSKTSSGYSPKTISANAPPESSVSAGSASPNPNEILQRNIFDSKTGPLWPPPEQDDLENEEKPPENIPLPGPNDPPPECEKELFLAAAAYFPNNPSQSVVVLDGPTEIDTQPLYRKGTTIGDLELVAIYPDIAYVKRPAGDYCSLKLYSERRRKKIRKKELKSEKTQQKKSKSEKAQQKKSRRAKMIERTKKRMKKRRKGK